MIYATRYLNSIYKVRLFHSSFVGYIYMSHWKYLDMTRHFPLPIKYFAWFYLAFVYNQAVFVTGHSHFLPISGGPPYDEINLDW